MHRWEDFRISLFFIALFTVLPFNSCVFLSCSPFVVITTFSTSLFGLSSFFCQKLQRPTRPVKNVVITTKGLQERKIQLLTEETSAPKRPVENIVITKKAYRKEKYKF